METSSKLSRIFSQGNAYQALSSNIILLLSHKNKLTPEMEKWAGLYYLKGTDCGGVLYTKCPRSKLTVDDLTALEKYKNYNLPKANRRAQDIIAKAVNVGTSGQDIHLFDMGCGAYPLVNRLTTNANIAFTGIDIVEHSFNIGNPNIALIANDGKKTISWDQLLANPIIAAGKMPVCTASYSLHYLDKQSFFNGLHDILDPNGLFIGNMLTGPRQSLQNKRIKEVKMALKANKWAYECIPDGRANSFFVASQRDNKNMMRLAAKALKAQL